MDYPLNVSNCYIWCLCV